MSAEKALRDPGARVEREPQTLAEALDLLQQDAEAKGVDKLTMEEIDAEIAAYRREQREKERLK
jgi:hypothetical protein